MCYIYVYSKRKLHMQLDPVACIFYTRNLLIHVFFSYLKFPCVYHTSVYTYIYIVYTNICVYVFVWMHTRRKTERIYKFNIIPYFDVIHFFVYRYTSQQWPQNDQTPKMILKGSIPKYLRSGWWIKLKFLQCITVAIAGTDLSNMRHTCKMARNGECDDQPFITFMCSPWCSSLHPNILHNHWGNWISQVLLIPKPKIANMF